MARACTPAHVNPLNVENVCRHGNKKQFHDLHYWAHKCNCSCTNYSFRTARVDVTARSKLILSSLVYKYLSFLMLLFFGFVAVCVGFALLLPARMAHWTCAICWQHTKRQTAYSEWCLESVRDRQRWQFRECNATRLSAQFVTSTFLLFDCCYCLFLTLVICFQSSKTNDIVTNSQTVTMPVPFVRSDTSQKKNKQQQIEESKSYLAY